MHCRARSVVGRVSERAWLRAFRQDAATAQGGLCRYCGEPLKASTISADHVKPRSTGGATTRENIKAACIPCNKTKGSLSEKQFLAAIKAPPVGAPFYVWMAYMRRRIWMRTHRACRRIERAVS